MGKKLTPEEAGRALAILGKIQAHRFFWKASGYIDRDLERPVIAITNSMQDAGVGHATCGNSPGTSRRASTPPAARPSSST